MKDNTIKIDARKLPCPLPLLKLKQALNRAENGDKIVLRATDPASQRDFRSFVTQTSHLLTIKKVGNEFHFTVIKQS
ncbi:MAG: response regulator SirA [Gammaproteobacteria bacterium]|nr:MAG: response regulator SirA [Gammaproteobacteria bacterium]